jgi:hypothetical protein
MKLHAPRVESQLRRSVRAVVRRSPAMAAEARRFRRQRRRQHSGDRWLLWVIRTGVLLTLMALTPLSVGAELRSAAGCQMALFTFWALTTVLMGAQQFCALLEGDEERVSLLHLPISDHAICQRQSGKFLRRTAWSAVEAAAVYCWLGGFQLEPSPIPFWVWVAPAALLHWLLTLAASVILVQHARPGPRTSLTIFVLWAGFCALLFDRVYLGPWLARQLDAGADWLTMVIPTGWPTALFHGVARGDWLTLLLLAPSGLVLWLGTISWRQLRAGFLLSELEPAADPNGTDEETIPPPESFSGAKGPTALVDEIRRRDFLTPSPPWDPNDALERTAVNWLTPREHLLAEVAVEPRPGWTRHWWRALLIYVVGTLCAWGLQSLGSRFFGWVDGVVLLFMAGNSLSTGVNTSHELVGLLPIRLNELLRLRLKFWLIRSTSALPLFAVAGAVLAWRLGASPALGAGMGLKGALLLHALFPYGGLGGWEQDQQSVRTAFVLLGLVCVGTSCAFGVAAFAPGFWGKADWLSWLCVPAAVLPSWFFVAIYLWRFNRGRIDLPLAH